MLIPGLNYTKSGKNIKNFIQDDQMSVEEKIAHDFYEGRQDDYEKYLHLTFYTFGESEREVRTRMLGGLGLDQKDVVLEVAAGTGRDSRIIAEQLDAHSDNPSFFVTDISSGMLAKAEEKLEDFHFCEFIRCTASSLPFESNSVDALFSFGGVGEFGDIKSFFEEAVRVVKPGGKVIVGDENLPLWQRKTKFGQILSNYNPQFLAHVPFDSLPVEARDVKCEWIIGGVFYLLSFNVGEGEPFANFEFEIPGVRGGTHMTRFFGQLEGVTDEAKDLAWQAVTKTKTNMHSWLDTVVKTEAKRILKND
jgi:ubiquinone/menaquinone biosynthesis C-methylase UbiE